MADSLSFPSEEGKYTGSNMDYTYGDAKQNMRSVSDDLKTLAWKLPSHTFSVVYNFLRTQSGPGLAGEMVEIAGMLPHDSPIRNAVQAKTVATLYKSLQHPPASYLGEKHQYRTADGSYHNFMFPDFGKARTPYAKTVRSAKKLHGVKPDPGVLFDLLEARGDTFRKNEAGISSMFLYHAAIIIHDLFNTDRRDSNTSETSSYLDLAPLYGSSQEQQDRVRLGKDGLLKPDTFHEDRLLGQPPGVNVLLVLYSRFHNYVATMLKEINEDGRFTLRQNTSWENKQDDAKEGDKRKTRRDPEKALDNDIFQTARLIVGGLYISISLGDYLRAIQGVHEKDTTWNFDPRMYIDKTPLGEGLPRGGGNQASCEFNLLYRFHSAISERDAKWTEDFFRTLLPEKLQNDENFELDKLTPGQLGRMLMAFAEGEAAKEPSVRTFGNITRGDDGKFRDEDLVRILTESIDDPAGAFGARQVPKALKVIEVAGIMQARKWEVASLNEFRTFFGLEPHATFESVNPDKDIQMALQNLYDSPDMIEMYPGIFVEELKKPKGFKPSGVGFPATAGRGVLSDAVTLVRSDRFYTTDYTTATLTNWGLCEAASDYKTLGGSMFHKLLHRGLPGSFAFNSVYAMQPMYTSQDNERILTRLKTLDQFSLHKPAVPQQDFTVDTHAAVSQALLDEGNFKSPWMSLREKHFSESAIRAYTSFQREANDSLLYRSPKAAMLYLDFLIGKAKSLVEGAAHCLGSQDSNDMYKQIDFVRDVAIPLNARFLAELFCLNVKSRNSNPYGVHTASELYKLLLEVRSWTHTANPDIAAQWYKRRKAQESALKLTETTSVSVPKAAGWAISSWLWGPAANEKDAEPANVKEVGADIAKSLREGGRSETDVAQIMWMMAVSGVGSPVTAFTEVLDYFLSDNGAAHWPEIQRLARDNSEESNRQLGLYFLEAQRLTSEQVCKGTIETEFKIGTQSLEANTNVILLISQANQDPRAFPSPAEFNVNRKDPKYITTGFGPTPTLSHDILLAYGTALLKTAAQLQGLRRAPNEMGGLKRVQLDAGRRTQAQVHGRWYMTPDWGYLVAEPTTWKLDFDTFSGTPLSA